jgi:hypothetical protein
MLSRAVRTTDAHAFFNLLTDDSTLDQVEVQLPMHRERLLPPTETLAMFLAQALSADRSCQHAVNRFVAGRVAGGLSACSTATGAYCRARKRLPEEMVRHLVRQTGRAMTAAMPVTWTWRGQPVRLVDGSTVSMPDTTERRSGHPQVGISLHPIEQFHYFREMEGSEKVDVPAFSASLRDLMLGDDRTPTSRNIPISN